MRNNNHINLSPRLEKIAELVPCSEAVADIGTDHAYIPVQLILSGKVKSAIASDIKKGPVARARETIKNYKLEDKIDVRLGAGLSTVNPHDADVIIIAGMGGILISDILNASRDVASSAKVLILQPMTAVYELREYLSCNNYSVESEYLVQEDDKLYNIMVATPNRICEYSFKELYFGKGLEETSPDLCDIYYQGVLSKLQKRADGLRKSNSDESHAELERILNIISKLRSEIHDKIV